MQIRHFNNFQILCIGLHFKNTSRINIEDVWSLASSFIQSKESCIEFLNWWWKWHYWWCSRDDASSLSTNWKTPKVIFGLFRGVFLWNIATPFFWFSSWKDGRSNCIQINRADTFPLVLILHDCLLLVTIKHNISKTLCLC